MKSGTTPSCSQANIVPVRPKPVITSSRMSRRRARRTSGASSASIPRGHSRMPGRALDQRLDDDARQVVAGSSASQFLQRRHMLRRKLPRRKPPVKQPDAAEARRAHRVAVVGAARKRRTACRCGCPVCCQNCARHFQRHLDRRGAVVGKENARQRVRRPERDEFLRELRRRRMGEAEERSVRHAVELRADRGVDLRMPMAVEIRPDRGIAVDDTRAPRCRAAARLRPKRAPAARAPARTSRDAA